MQLRISQGPYYALGLPDTASPEDVRAAFLALTKQFHPARFGRMSPELQKLSNEVFLGIKSAHDALVRIVGAPRGRGPSSLRPTGGMPPIVPEGSARTASVPGTGPVPRRASIGTAPPATQPVAFARGTDRSAPSMAPGQSGAIPRAAQSGPIPQASQSGSFPKPRTATGQVPPLQRPGAAAPRPTPSGLPPRAPADGFNPPTVRGRSTSESPANRPMQRGAAPPAATNFDVATQRGIPPHGAGAVSSHRASHSQSMPAATNFDIATQRGVVPTQPLQRIAPQGPTSGAHAAVFDERGALAEALALMEARNWTGARHALHALAAKVPQSKQYRALLCYARGREAHVAGRSEDALLEYQRALHLDPDLAQVKQAVTELQRRR